MKILHTVQRYAPDSGGSEEVVRQLSEHLVSFGHEVTVATGKSATTRPESLNGVAIREFRCAGNSVEGIRGSANDYVDFVRTGRFDLMMNYAAQIWSSDLIYELLPSLGMKKVFVPCGYSRLTDPLFRGYFERMPAILRAYDRVVYLSANYLDSRFAEVHGLHNGIVIPNGADTREFMPVKDGAFRERFGLDDEVLILNVSNHSQLKNHRFFWNAVGKLRGDRVKPFLVGNAYFHSPKKWLKECYSECRIKGVRYAVPVLEDLPRNIVVEAFRDADIFLFGSKVECSPLVMFEAFASKTLFITTDCGNVKDFGDIACIVSDEREAVDIIRDYLQRPQRYRERIEKGYDLFVSELNWEAIARRYEQLYLGLVK